MNKLKQYHDFKFTTSFNNKWSLTEIEIDGMLLKGVTAAEIIYKPNEIPVIKLEFIPDNVSVEAEKCPFLEDDEDGEDR